MRLGQMIVLTLAAASAGCSPPPITGAADDGENFSGIAVQSGFWDVSGSLMLTGDRGTSCSGLFVYDGMMGPRGKATYSCNNGQHGEAQIEGISAGTGEGNIGPRRIKFSWGRRA
jgi:hypothetical protein